MDSGTEGVYAGMEGVDTGTEGVDSRFRHGGMGSGNNQARSNVQAILKTNLLKVAHLF
jgi:hypothetical protein